MRRLRRETVVFICVAVAAGACRSTSPSMPDASVAPDASVPDAGSRDWTISPAIVQVESSNDIWAVSDIHGDYEAIAKLLLGANIIATIPDTPAEVVWTKNTDVLVVVGDLIDKGPDAPDVVRLLMALQSSASAAGGTVVVTMGNHEAEFLANPENSDATKTGLEEGLDPELQADDLTPQQTAAGDDDIGAFMRGLPIAARVDDWFFVHAGNTGGASVAGLSSEIVTEVGSLGFGAPVLAADTSMLEARLSSTAPQWWDATGDASALLTQWTAALGVQHLVMGHQPGTVGFEDGTTRAQDQMYAAFGGLIFLIDTGMSIGVDDTGGALLHIKNAGSSSESWEEVLPDGSKMSL